MSDPRSQVLSYLESQAIDFQTFEHPALFTVEQATEYEDKIPGLHTKNIFIRDKKNNYTLITLRADKRMDTRVFKMQSNIKDFSFATPEQLLEQLNLTPGSVGIFGLLHNPKIKLYIDQDIRSADRIGRHPNDNTATVVISKDGFKTFLDSLGISYEVIML